MAIIQTGIPKVSQFGAEDLTLGVAAAGTATALVAQSIPSRQLSPLTNTPILPKPLPPHTLQMVVTNLLSGKASTAQRPMLPAMPLHLFRPPTTIPTTLKLAMRSLSMVLIQAMRLRLNHHMPLLMVRPLPLRHPSGQRSPTISRIADIRAVAIEAATKTTEAARAPRRRHAQAVTEMTLRRPRVPLLAIPLVLPLIQIHVRKLPMRRS